MANKTRINIQDRESLLDVKIFHHGMRNIEWTVSEELMLSSVLIIYLNRSGFHVSLLEHYLDMVAFLIFVHSLHIQECLCSKTLWFWKPSFKQLCTTLKRFYKSSSQQQNEKSTSIFVSTKSTLIRVSSPSLRRSNYILPANDPFVTKYIHLRYMNQD